MVLTSQDRCGSRCGAQAYVRAFLSGGDLLFCGHHWREAADRLTLIAEIIDERPPEMRW
jgi:hypothetical protein